MVFVPTPVDLSAASEGKMITFNILLHSYKHKLRVQSFYYCLLPFTVYSNAKFSAYDLDFVDSFPDSSFCHDTNRTTLGQKVNS